MSARREPHTIIIAKGDRVRHFTMGRVSVCMAALLAAGLGFGAAAGPAFYFLGPQADIQPSETEWHLTQSYEQRISDLRAQLDKATSRRFMSEQVVETKVDVLLDQQEELAARYEKLAPLFDRARETGMIAAAVPVPMPRSAVKSREFADGPEDGAGPVADMTSSYSMENGMEPSPAADAIDTLATGGIFRPAPAVAPQDATPPAPIPARRTAAAQRDVVGNEAISGIGREMDEAEWRQITGLRDLAYRTRTRAVKIATALEAAGISIPWGDTEPAKGGPLQLSDDTLGSSGGAAFNASYAELDAALATLKDAQAVAEALPLSAPMPARSISSRFGARSDPFLGRSAMHTGIDYAAPAGTAIKAQAGGVVTRAGSQGGYGNMVEIDHGNGIKSRFAHLSRVAVTVGRKVAAGQIVGMVGSTGRSTGPHLHYEITANGKAIDPMRLYRIGDKLGDLV